MPKDPKDVHVYHITPYNWTQLSRSTLEVPKHIPKKMMKRESYTVGKKVRVHGDNAERRMTRSIVFSSPF